MKFVCFLLLLAACAKVSKEDEVPLPTPTPSVTPSPSPAEDRKYAVIKGENGLEYHTGLIHTDKEKEMRPYGKLHVVLADCENLPESFDLRTIGTVPPVRNQGNCGSCWAYSKTASLESAVLAAGGKLLDLSEQELVSCDKQQYGCGGGMLDDFKYQIEKGQSLEADFPYTSGRTGRNGSCIGGLKAAAKGVGLSYVGSADRSPTEKELMCALYKSHTVPWITVSASGSWGSPPKSEDTLYTRCGHGGTNHAVGVIGWKKINGKLGFIMKNSWGTDWGDKGYMVMPLGCDSFGEEVAFIQVIKPEPTPTPPGPTPPPSPTPTPPCLPPKSKLPAEVQVFQDTEVMLGVKAEAGVEYSWTSADKIMGTESMLYVTVAADAVYKLTAKNACATAESSVRVRIVHSI